MKREVYFLPIDLKQEGHKNDLLHSRILAFPCILEKPVKPKVKHNYCISAFYTQTTLCYNERESTLFE